jgi:hypothetical protein
VVIADELLFKELKVLHNVSTGYRHYSSPAWFIRNFHETARRLVGLGLLAEIEWDCWYRLTEEGRLILEEAALTLC